MLKMPIILITNDDGIDSDGIFALWKAMSQLGDAYVVAPDIDRSASSNSMTISKPLKVKTVTKLNRFSGYSVNGTPVDCVKIAVKSLLKNKPDVLISGINNGSNLGDNIIYSGTVAAATEGAMLGIPSIAVSLDSHKPTDYNCAKYFSALIVKNVLKNGLSKGVVLNVNIPNIKKNQINGVRITKQGNQSFEDEYEKQADNKGVSEYMIKGKIVDNDNSVDYDGKAVKENYVSITPIQYNLTELSYVEKLMINYKNE